ncbi:MAG: FHA domain-containing protein [Bradymonadales bacterium]
MLRLLIEDFEGKSKLAPINPETADITIGRKEGNVIRLKERNVSRRHARLYAGADGIYVEPVEARYGIKVNSSKIDGPMRVSFGDEIRIGDYRLYLQDESLPQVIKQPAAVAQGAVDIPPAMQPKLVVVSSNFAGREYPITKGIVTLGRNPTCDLHIEHVSVSGNHAKITRNARGNFEIEDLGSSNGLKINWLPCTGVHELFSGDTVILGHVMMRYCAPGELWYFNPGGFDDEPKRSAPMLGLVIGLLLLAVVGAVLVTLYVTGVFDDKPTQEVVTTTVVVKDANTEMLQLATACENNIFKMDLTLARTNCEKAYELNPSNPMVLNMMDSLNREETAMREYEDAKNALADGKCQEAIDMLEGIDSTTRVYEKLVRDNDVRNKAIKCRDDEIVLRFNSAFNSQNLDEAEKIYEELARRSQDRARVQSVGQQLQAAKAPARSDSGGRGTTRRPTTQETIPAPSNVNIPAIKERMQKATNTSALKAAYNELPSSEKNKDDVLCVMATKLKIFAPNSCEPYRYYERAQSGSCAGPAKEFVSKNREKCGK